MTILTPERVREVLSYDPITGILHWKVSTARRIRAGDIAGCDRGDGYIMVGIDTKMYLAHRLAFVIMTGKWPVGLVDHESTDNTDNRWGNLRDANSGENVCNQGRKCSNTTGYKGVYRHSDGYFGAMIQSKGYKLHLGLFKEVEHAAAAYRIAAACVHGRFART